MRAAMARRRIAGARRDPARCRACAAGAPSRAGAGRRARAIFAGLLRRGSPIWRTRTSTSTRSSRLPRACTRASRARSRALPPPGQRIALAARRRVQLRLPASAGGLARGGRRDRPFSPLADEAPPDGVRRVLAARRLSGTACGALAAAQRFRDGLRAIRRDAAGPRRVRRLHGARRDAGGRGRSRARDGRAARPRHSFAKRRMNLGYREATLLARGALGARRHDAARPRVPLCHASPNRARTFRSPACATAGRGSAPPEVARPCQRHVFPRHRPSERPRNDPKRSRMTDFDSSTALRAACLALPDGDDAAAAAVASRQAQLTKPPGSLGRLEALVAWLARWQRRSMPRLDRVEVLVFAGNHGVAARGVSAYPAEVTAQMVANFAAGGAAINQLARFAGATLRVMDLDLAHPTADFTLGPAMDERGFLDAAALGAAAVPNGMDLLCLGEMGIGNTTRRSRDRGCAVRRRRRALGRTRDGGRRRRPRAQAVRRRRGACAPHRSRRRPPCAGRSAGRA